MSFNSHRRAVLDPTRPLAHRASHARSCALHVASRFSVERQVIFDVVLHRTGIDLQCPGDEASLLQAFATLEALRQEEKPSDL